MTTCSGRGGGRHVRQRLLGRHAGGGPLDAVPTPINRLDQRERLQQLRQHMPDVLEMLRSARVEQGIVVYHTLVYQIVAPALCSAGLRLLHPDLIPFPLGNWRTAFVYGVRAAGVTPDHVTARLVA